jgi:hypothetical protein
VNSDIPMNEIVFYSSTGVAVLTIKNVKSNQAIDITSLSSGIYQCVAKTGESLLVRQFSKQ